MSIKKMTSFLLALTIIIVFAGCSNKKNAYNLESGLNEAGNFYSNSDRGNTEFAKELPCAISYNGKSVFIKDATAYEVQTSNYAYTLYVIIDVDASDLDDAEFHWLREEDISANAYITNEKNEYDFESAYRLGSLDSKKTISFVFISSPFDKCRYSFAGGEVTISVSLKQEDSYEYKKGDGGTGKIHKENSGMYKIILPDELPSAETIPEPLYGYIVKWLAAKAEAYK